MNIFCILVLGLSLLFELAVSNGANSKQSQHAKHVNKILPKSRGRPFPQPQVYMSTDTQHVLDERAFAFQYVAGSVVCELLSSAFNRYYKIIFRPQSLDYMRRVSVKKVVNHKLFESNGPHAKANSLLKRVVVNVREPCEDYPSLESDESCILR